MSNSSTKKPLGSITPTSTDNAGFDFFKYDFFSRFGSQSSGSSELITEDFNNDGKIDLLWPGRVAINISATGTTIPVFSMKIDFPLSGILASGDFNGDGRIDVISTSNSEDFNVFLNDTPQGEITPIFSAISIPSFIGKDNPKDFASGDFNNDGKPDLIEVTQVAANFLINTTPTGAKNPAFTPPVSRGIGEYLISNDYWSKTSIALTDLNGDNRLDVALINNNNLNQGTVSILMNTTPQGSLTPSFAPKQDVLTRSKIREITVIDANSDGVNDLVIFDNDGHPLFLLNYTPQNSSTAVFSYDQLINNNQELPIPIKAVANDFNRDGKPDLALIGSKDSRDLPFPNSFWNSHLTILANQTPTGTNNLSFSIAKSNRATDFGLATADLNNDGKPDLISANQIPSFMGYQAVPNISVLANNTFTPNVPSPQVGGVLMGTNNDENLIASVGNDQIMGMGGKDSIYGSFGDDLIYGQQDNDFLDGQGGNDTIYGGKGMDLIAGDDLGDPASGNDLIFGNNDNDELLGGNGNDTIYGGKNNDIIMGQNGQDWLWGNLGDDTLGQDGSNDSDIFVLQRGAGQDLIREFVLQQDLIGLAGGLSFNDLTILPGPYYTTIKYGNEVLANVIISPQKPGLLDANSFINVLG